MSTNVTAQTIKDVSSDLVKYWKPVLDTLDPHAPYFTAKIFYFSTDLGAPAQAMTRMFPSELKKVGGVYLEMLDFELQPRTVGFRTLYYLPYNANFAAEYKFVDNAQGGAYLIPASALTEVNRTSTHLPAPVILAPGESPELPPASTVTETAPELVERAFAQPAVNILEDRPELADDNYSKMTIRDYFAITHLKPVSSKGWLNQLIIEQTTAAASLQ